VMVDVRLRNSAALRKQSFDDLQQASNTFPGVSKKP